MTVIETTGPAVILVDAAAEYTAPAGSDVYLIVGVNSGPPDSDSSSRYQTVLEPLNPAFPKPVWDISVHRMFHLPFAGFHQVALSGNCRPRSSSDIAFTRYTLSVLELR